MHCVQARLGRMTAARGLTSSCACRVRPAMLSAVPSVPQLTDLLKQQAVCVCTLKQPAQQVASAKGFERLLMASISSPGATSEGSSGHFGHT